MNSPDAVDVVPNEVSVCQHCTSLFLSASAVLGAYIAAVEQRFGSETAKYAGSYWVDLLEQSAALNNDARSEFRWITILASAHLADLMVRPAFSKSSSATWDG